MDGMIRKSAMAGARPSTRGRRGAACDGRGAQDNIIVAPLSSACAQGYSPMDDRQHAHPAADPSGADETPTFRPSERLWPYVDVPEQPSDEEIAALDPDLQAALFGHSPRPFSISLVFPPFEAPDYQQAMALARASREYRETGQGASLRHRARFEPSE